MGAQKEAKYANIWYIDKKNEKKMNQILHMKQYIYNTVNDKP